MVQDVPLRSPEYVCVCTWGHNALLSVAVYYLIVSTRSYSHFSVVVLRWSKRVMPIISRTWPRTRQHPVVVPKSGWWLDLTKFALAKRIGLSLKRAQWTRRQRCSWRFDLLSLAEHFDWWTVCGLVYVCVQVFDTFVWRQLCLARNVCDNASHWLDCNILYNQDEHVMSSHLAWCHVTHWEQFGCHVVCIC